MNHHDYLIIVNPIERFQIYLKDKELIRYKYQSE